MSSDGPSTGTTDTGPADTTTPTDAPPTAPTPEPGPPRPAPTASPDTAAVDPAPTPDTTPDSRFGEQVPHRQAGPLTGPPATPTPAQRDVAPVGHLQTERADPDRTNPLHGVDGELARSETTIRADVRRIEVAPGVWVRELTVPLHLTGHPADVATVRDRIDAALDRHVNGRYQLDGGDQLRVRVDTGRPSDTLPPHIDPVAATVEVSSVHDGRENQQSLSPTSPDAVLVHEVLHYTGLPDRYSSPESALRHRMGPDREQGGVMGPDARRQDGPVDLTPSDLQLIDTVLAGGPLVRDHPWTDAGPLAGPPPDAPTRDAPTTDAPTTDAPTTDSSRAPAAPAPSDRARPTPAPRAKGKGKGAAGGPSRPAPPVHPTEPPAERPRPRGFAPAFEGRRHEVHLDVRRTQLLGTPLPPRADGDTRPGFVATVPVAAHTRAADLVDLVARYEQAAGDTRTTLVLGVNAHHGRAADVAALVNAVADGYRGDMRVLLLDMTWHSPRAAASARRNPEAVPGTEINQRTVPYGALREAIARDPATLDLIEEVGRGSDAPTYLHLGDSDVASLTTTTGRGLFPAAATRLDGGDVHLLSGGYRGPTDGDADQRAAMDRDTAVRGAMAAVDPASVYPPEPNTFVRVDAAGLADQESFGTYYGEGRALADSVITHRGLDTRTQVAWDPALSVETDLGRLWTDDGTLTQSHARPQTLTDQIVHHLEQRHGGPPVATQDLQSLAADALGGTLVPATFGPRVRGLGLPPDARREVGQMIGNIARLPRPATVGPTNGAPGPSRGSGRARPASAPPVPEDGPPVPPKDAPPVPPKDAPRSDNPRPDGPAAPPPTRGTPLDSVPEVAAVPTIDGRAGVEYEPDDDASDAATDGPGDTVFPVPAVDRGPVLAVADTDVDAVAEAVGSSLPTGLRPDPSSLDEVRRVLRDDPGSLRGNGRTFDVTTTRPGLRALLTRSTTEHHEVRVRLGGPPDPSRPVVPTDGSGARTREEQTGGVDGGIASVSKDAGGTSASVGVTTGYLPGPGGSVGVGVPLPQATSHSTSTTETLRTTDARKTVTTEQDVPAHVTVVRLGDGSPPPQTVVVSATTRTPPADTVVPDAPDRDVTPRPGIGVPEGPTTLGPDVDRLFDRLAAQVHPSIVAPGSPGRADLRSFLELLQAPGALAKLTGGEVASPELTSSDGKHRSKVVVRPASGDGGPRPMTTTLVGRSGDGADADVPSSQSTEQRATSESASSTSSSRGLSLVGAIGYMTRVAPPGTAHLTGAGGFFAGLVGRYSTRATVDASSSRSQEARTTATSTGPTELHRVRMPVEFQVAGHRPVTDDRTLTGQLRMTPSEAVRGGFADGPRAAAGPATSSGPNATGSGPRRYLPDFLQHGRALGGSLVTGGARTDGLAEQTRAAVRRLPGFRTLPGLGDGALRDADADTTSRAIDLHERIGGALSRENLDANLDQLLNGGMTVPLEHDGHVRSHLATLRITATLTPVTGPDHAGSGGTTLASQQTSLARSGASTATSRGVELGAEGGPNWSSFAIEGGRVVPSPIATVRGGRSTETGGGDGTDVGRVTAISGGGDARPVPARVTYSVEIEHSSQVRGWVRSLVPGLPKDWGTRGLEWASGKASDATSGRVASTAPSRSPDRPTMTHQPTLLVPATLLRDTPAADAPPTSTVTTPDGGAARPVARHAASVPDVDRPGSTAEDHRDPARRDPARREPTARGADRPDTGRTGGGLPDVLSVVAVTDGGAMARAAHEAIAEVTARTPETGGDGRPRPYEAARAGVTVGGTVRPRRLAAPDLADADPTADLPTRKRRVTDTVTSLGMEITGLGRPELIATVDAADLKSAHVGATKVNSGRAITRHVLAGLGFGVLGNATGTVSTVGPGPVAQPGVSVTKTWSSTRGTSSALSGSTETGTTTKNARVHLVRFSGTGETTAEARDVNAVRSLFGRGPERTARREVTLDGAVYAYIDDAERRRWDALLTDDERADRAREADEPPTSQPGPSHPATDQASADRAPTVPGPDRLEVPVGENGWARALGHGAVSRHDARGLLAQLRDQHPDLLPHDTTGDPMTVLRSIRALTSPMGTAGLMESLASPDGAGRTVDLPTRTGHTPMRVELRLVRTGDPRVVAVDHQDRSVTGKTTGNLTGVVTRARERSWNVAARVSGLRRFGSGDYGGAGAGGSASGTRKDTLGRSDVDKRETTRTHAGTGPVATIEQTGRFELVVHAEGRPPVVVTSPREETVRVEVPASDLVTRPEPPTADPSVPPAPTRTPPPPPARTLRPAELGADARRDWRAAGADVGRLFQVMDVPATAVRSAVRDTLAAAGARPRLLDETRRGGSAIRQATSPPNLRANLHLLGQGRFGFGLNPDTLFGGQRADVEVDARFTVRETVTADHEGSLASTVTEVTGVETSTARKRSGGIGAGPAGEGGNYSDPPLATRVDPEVAAATDAERGRGGSTVPGLDGTTSYTGPTRTLDLDVTLRVVATVSDRPGRRFMDWATSGPDQPATDATRTVGREVPLGRTLRLKVPEEHAQLLTGARVDDGVATTLADLAAAADRWKDATAALRGPGTDAPARRHAVEDAEKAWWAARGRFDDALTRQIRAERGVPVPVPDPAPAPDPVPAPDPAPAPDPLAPVPTSPPFDDADRDRVFSVSLGSDGPDRHAEPDDDPFATWLAWDRGHPPEHEPSDPDPGTVVNPETSSDADRTPARAPADPEPRRRGLLDGDGPRIRYDVRRIQADDGSWVTDVTVRLRYAGDPRLAGAVHRDLTTVLDRDVNRRHRLPDGSRLHVTVDAEFGESRYPEGRGDAADSTDSALDGRTTVSVGGPDATVDQTHWSSAARPELHAHEVLHFLGLPDRYDDATVVLGRGLDADGPMGRRAATGPLRLTEHDIAQIADVLASGPVVRDHPLGPSEPVGLPGLEGLPGLDGLDDPSPWRPAPAPRG